MSLLPVGIGNAGGEYTLENSLRFRSSSTGYLYRDVTTTGNRKTFTYSCWLKITEVDTTQIFSCGTSGSSVLQARIVTNNGLQIYQESGGATNLQRYTGSSAYLRDFSAWYHTVFVVDTTQSTAGDRVKVYLNGVQLTSFSSSVDPSLNYDTLANYNDMWVGSYLGNVTSDTYQTEVHFLDGYAATADDFGEFDNDTGVWKPKEYVGGNYGTNGFYLPMTATTQAEGFNTVLYTGNGASQSIGDVGFTPDFVWIKKRSGAENHGLFDTVRGAGNFLVSNSTDSEYARGNSITTFDADGFSLGNYSNTNVSGGTNVAWCWDAGANQATTGISSVAYTGTGAARPVAGFGFSPDLVWIKRRDSAANHCLTDTVRGATNTLFSDDTFAESTGLDGVTSFDSDGVTLGTNASHNSSGNTFVAWGWDAGDGDPVTNTQGSQNSTVKANDATGFSIITYTGTGANATYGHGLSTAPELLIIKSRSGSGASYQWMVGSDVQGWSNDMVLNSSGNNGSSSRFQSTAPTSTVFSVSGDSNVNASGQTYVAYAFDSVAGVSSIGSYQGNGSASGPSVTLGFRPGFLLIKGLDVTGGASWLMVDGTRNPFNPVDASLYADDSAAEGAADRVNFTDTGFEVITTSTLVNENTKNYLYMAFKGSYSDYVSPLNTDGDIDSRVKANTTQGFSIVSWEGNGSNSTIGHGLSSAPEFFFLKNRDTAVNDWIVYQSDVGATKFLRLNQTNATTTQTNIFNDTEPTSSVFTVGTNSAVNSSGVNYIAYCWHSVAGYSNFGTYTGTGSSGNTVTTGFRPAFLMIKSTGATATGWIMVDNTRDPDNLASEYIYADSSAAEATYTNILEFTDTGFELLIGAGSAVNQSGVDYIYMAFADTRDAQFNFDASGNKNNFTANNINSNASSESSYDIMTDVPTLTDENTANYCTWNNLDKPAASSTTNGNLTATTSTAASEVICGTFGVSSGKWYWEVTPSAITSGGCMIGIRAINQTTAAIVSTTDGYGYYTTGRTYSSSPSVTYGDTFTTNDIIGVAFDADNGKIWWAKNGVWQASGDPAAGTNEAYSGISGTYKPAVSNGGSTSACTVNTTFGQQPFAYTPPTGFLPLNTYNLPDATIEDGSEHFETVLFSANNSTQDITGLEFAPDFVWLKSRSNSYSHELFDKLRGVNKILYSNSTNAETTTANSLTSFNSDGFSLGASSNANFGSGSSVGWNWKANGSGVSNTVGDTNATVSANTTSGFSIVSFNAGAAGNHTVGHGLGVTPEMIIMKDRDSSGYGNWTVFHSSVCTSTSNYLLLNGTGGLGSVANSWGSALPTSTVFGFGSNVNVAANDNIISYCFASVEGFSAFGKYTGNGSTDGTFIYTGFRPAWVVVKRTSSGGTEWVLFDTKRDSYNEAINFLFPSSALAENPAPAYYGLDFVSNGFKWRQVHTPTNTSGATYIYAAFAENPFKNALAR